MSTKTSLLFSTAVLSTLGQILATSPNRFSALGVTKALRERVSNGEIEITDVPQIPLPDSAPNAGVLVSEVAYPKVKQLLAELHESVSGPLSLSEFVPTRTKDATTGASYYEYVKGDGNITLTPVTLPNTPPPTVKPPTTSVLPTIQSPANLKGGEVENIVSYVRNKLAAGQCPSLKQIQSRLKDTSLRCKDIALVLSSAGATLANNPQAFSLTVVTALAPNRPVPSTPVTVKPAQTSGLYPYAAIFTGKGN
jgi:hypothetical protein